MDIMNTTKGDFTVKRSVKFFATALLVIFVIITLSPLSAADYRAGANAASDAYKAGKYYDNLSKVPLTGDGVTDALAVALSQLGYQEGNSLAQLDGTTPTAGNFTEYNYNMGDFGIGYGGLEYHWCASFVSFCLYQSRCHDYGDFFDCARYHLDEPEYIWREISCQYWTYALRLANRFYDSEYFGGNHTPSSGDLIFFTRDGKTASHIGIVLYTEGNTVYTVEGNTSSASKLEINGGGVYVKNYKKTSSQILGFGVLPYKRDDSVKKIDYSGNDPTAGYYTSKGVKYLYTDPYATTRAEINLPKYTMFYVDRVASGKGLSAVLECRYNGVTYYIKNNTDRIYQITREEDTPLPDTTAEETTEIKSVEFAPPLIEEAPAIVTETLPETVSVSPETSIVPETTAAPETAQPQKVIKDSSPVVSTVAACALASTLAGAIYFVRKEDQ